MIAFWFEDPKEEFEYDVRGLLGSFYPGIAQQKLPARPDAEEALSYDAVIAIPAPEETENPADRKNAFKRRLYRMLAERTGRSLPWGTLTGIRPTKLVTQLMEEGAAEEEIRRHMQAVYYLDGEKLDLSLAIARKELEVLSGIHYTDGFSLYIGIPFCPTRCSYCSFTAYPLAAVKDQVEPYLESLFEELRVSAPFLQGKILDSVYIGGGTPTALSAGQMDRLLTQVEAHYDLSRIREFTVEAGRPDSIDAEKLAVLRAHAVSRISVNPQTALQKTLDKIGRWHTVEDTERAFRLARSMGFDNINMDIILGLPGEDAADVRTTMAWLDGLRPDSLTVHSLAIKRASRLRMETIGTLVAGPGQEESETMMRIGREGAAAMGLDPYYLYRQKNMAGNLENVGFAAPGKAGIYNILIMEEKQSILACGAGTISKAVRADGLITRQDNVKDLRLYREKLPELLRDKEALFSAI